MDVVSLVEQSLLHVRHPERLEHARVDRADDAPRRARRRKQAQCDMVDARLTMPMETWPPVTATIRALGKSAILMTAARPFNTASLSCSMP
jgi:hypothetical protein